MDWKTIHAYAEEVELWTTLAINCWLLIGGTIFLLIRFRKVAISLQRQIAESVAWSGLVVFAALLLVDGLYMVLWKHPSWAEGLLSLLTLCTVSMAMYISVNNIRKPWD